VAFVYQRAEQLCDFFTGLDRSADRAHYRLGHFGFSHA
jgi:hypothetical protein